jgi:hypothetical protein
MPRTPKTKAEPVMSTDFVRQFGTIERVDPDEDFSDVDGDPKNDFALVDEASDRHYVWAVNSRDGIGDYAGGVVPYRVERYEEEGVRAKMNAEQTKGELIEKKGHVLMSCDLELWQKRNRYERVQTLRTNETMFKRRQRTLDLRQADAVRSERESLRG